MNRPPAGDTTPFAEAATVDPDARRLAEVMAELYRRSPARAPWMAGDGYTCDGGALAAYLAAARLGIPASLHVGLYWHSDPVLRAELMGDYQGDISDEEWAAHLAGIEAGMLDEHHHWVTLHPGTEQPVLVDPNGPIRREAYLSPADDVDDRYQDGAEHLIYDPADNPEQIAADIYPGLVQMLEAIIADQAWQ